MQRRREAAIVNGDVVPIVEANIYSPSNHLDPSTIILIEERKYLLGSGRFSTVYKATSTQLNKLVAVKVL